MILTPPAPATPRINGPSRFGVRPKRPVLYTVPATGDRPMKFAAQGLPPGVSIDADTGRLSGAAVEPGEYNIRLTATNRLGSGDKTFTLIVGDEIALTPPMGWNSYNVYGTRATQSDVQRAARAMVSSGLINHGWSYINIDDGWQGQRDPTTKALQPDPARFPDIKALFDEIHGLGLKTGLYSSPWVVTYGGRLGGSAENPDGLKQTWPKAARNKKELPYAIGKYSFAKQDVAQWLAWGVDYMKYDWAPIELRETKEMSDLLRESDRDIVYSLSNNATRTLLLNIGEIAPLAHAWRTTTDINDTWNSVQTIGFGNEPWNAFIKPGHYTDPDMLVVGVVGWGKGLRFNRLTPDQQYTHITMWCLLSAPLLLGCDMEQLDPFTLSLLTNDEVLAVNQDTKVDPARQAYSEDRVEVWTKKLDDGSTAVGIFNRNSGAVTHALKWSKAGVPAAGVVRDLWRQKDVPNAAEGVELILPPAGTFLFKISPAK